MGPDMTILECICQVVVFWAVCLVGWGTVRIVAELPSIVGACRPSTSRPDAIIVTFPPRST